MAAATQEPEHLCFGLPKNCWNAAFLRLSENTENTCKNTSLELLLAREIFQVLSSHISLALCAVLKLLDSSLSNERLEPRDWNQPPCQECRKRGLGPGRNLLVSRQILRRPMRSSKALTPTFCVPVLSYLSFTCLPLSSPNPIPLISNTPFLWSQICSFVPYIHYDFPGIYSTVI